MKKSCGLNFYIETDATGQPIAGSGRWAKRKPDFRFVDVTNAVASCGASCDTIPVVFQTLSTTVITNISNDRGVSVSGTITGVGNGMSVINIPPGDTVFTVTIAGPTDLAIACSHLEADGPPNIGVISPGCQVTSGLIGTITVTNAAIGDGYLVRLETLTSC